MGLAADLDDLAHDPRRTRRVRSVEHRDQRDLVDAFEFGVALLVDTPARVDLFALARIQRKLERAVFLDALAVFLADIAQELDAVAPIAEDGDQVDARIDPCARAVDGLAHFLGGILHEEARDDVFAAAQRVFIYLGHLDRGRARRIQQPAGAAGDAHAEDVVVGERVAVRIADDVAVIVE